MVNRQPLEITNENIIYGRYIGIINILRPRQNGHHIAKDIFKRISLNETSLILYEISLKYVPLRLIDNMAALFEIMTWRRTGDKPLSQPMMV